MHALCVSLVPVFNHLEQDDQEKIAAVARRALFQKDEIVHRPGDGPGKLYIVHKGRLKIYRLSESGREQLVRVLQPGDFAGELALFTRANHDSFAQALESSELCTLDRDDLQALLLRHPSISIRLLAEVARRLGRSEEQTTSLATESADTRIAMYLARLADDAESADVSLPMSRKDLASHLGTTPETVSRKLTEFQQAGWIRQSGRKRIRILDLDALLLV